MAIDATDSALLRLLQRDANQTAESLGAALGLSPAEAFLRLRLARVRRLLEGSAQSVTAIAAETGFCDASHLGRTFRSREGMSPEAWRRAAAESAGQTRRA